ncbi:MAG: hypothetical protein NUW37_03960 [Planctomycetes bacterium]|nr:hypothetical protein [Planctomycetota bacterium]
MSNEQNKNEPSLIGSSIGEAKEMAQKFRGEVARNLSPKSLRTALTWYFGVLILIPVLVVGFTFWQFSSSSIESVVKDRMNGIIDHTQSQVNNFLAPAVNAASTISDLVTLNVVPLEDQSELRQVFVSYLRESSQLQNLYIGQSDGNFLMVERFENGFRSKRVITSTREKLEGMSISDVLLVNEMDRETYRKTLETMAAIVANALAGKENKIDAWEEIESRIRSSAEFQPSIRQFHVAFPDGQFLMIWKTAESEMKSKWQSAPTAQRLGAGTDFATYSEFLGTVRFRDARGESGDLLLPVLNEHPGGAQVQLPENLKEKAAQIPQFDPRERTWWRKILETGNSYIWTDVYPFAQSGSLGVTGSLRRDYEEGSQNYFVVSVDLEFDVLEADERAYEEEAVQIVYYETFNENDLTWSPAAGPIGAYDCRTRGWYRDAVKSDYGTKVWQNVYVFKTSRLPGITVSLRVPQVWQDKSREMVVGADVGVKALSSFLKTEIADKGPTAFILDDSLKIVGYPMDDLSKLVSISDSGELSRITIGDLENASIGAVDTEKIVTALREGDDTEGFEYSHDGSDYFSASKAANVGNLKWYVIVSVLKEKVLGDIQRSAIITFMIAMLGLGIAIFVAFNLGKSISKPLDALVQAFEVVKDGEYFHVRMEMNANYEELMDLKTAFEKMLSGLQERAHLQRYVSGATLEAISRGRSSEKHDLGGQRVKRTVWFSDIRGFTAFSEKRSPEEVISMLNLFLNVQAQIIAKYGGDIDKFVGDEVMALFNGENEVERAVDCAIEIVERTEEINREKGSDIHVGIGINYGDVVSGNMGAEGRMDFTVIGDSVNFGARLCGAAKPGQILMSEASYEFVKDHIDAELIEGLKFKGKSDGLKVYSVSKLPSKN